MITRDQIFKEGGDRMPRKRAAATEAPAMRTLQETADELVRAADASLAPGGPADPVVPLPPPPAPQTATRPPAVGPPPSGWEPAPVPAQALKREAPSLPVIEGAMIDPRARLAASVQAASGARLSRYEVARAAGMPYPEYVALRRDPAYVTYVASLLEEAASRASAVAVSHRAWRMQAIQADIDRLNEVTEQRAAAADMRFASRDHGWLAARGVADPAAFVEQFPQVGELFDPSNPACSMFDPEDVFVPGAATGLLVKDVKTVGAGLAAEKVDVWSLDASLLRERSSLLKQAAQEAGEWGPSAGPGEAAPMKLYIGIDTGRL